MKVEKALSVTMLPRGFSSVAAPYTVPPMRCLASVDTFAASSAGALHTMPSVHHAEQPPQSSDDLADTLAADTVACRGYCAACGCEHRLPVGPALVHARDIHARMCAAGRIDIDVPPADADPRFSLDYVWGDARGQMFGVLAYRSADGKEGVLKAFSSQYNGVWTLAGWVPPILDATAFKQLVMPVDRQIKALGARIAECREHTPERTRLVGERKVLSRSLMQQIHDLYTVANFRGAKQPLRDVFLQKGLPNGAGDCCAPKLLQYAALHNLTPLGLVEWYVGQTNRSGKRVHGRWYPACAEKCQPLLGFMLCGLEAHR